MPSNPNMRGEKLRSVFTGLGFGSVGSVLASGNLVFSSEETDTTALESRIQWALNSELGIGGGTIIRSREELQALVDSDPFPGLSHCRETYLTVTFLKNGAPGSKKTTPPADLATTVRIVRYDEPAHALLAVLDNSVPQSTAYMAWLEKSYGQDITTRTWLTVHKILAKL
jgi:uncharacterized protein (DUF1697 family)